MKSASRYLTTFILSIAISAVISGCDFVFNKPHKLFQHHSLPGLNFAYKQPSFGIRGDPIALTDDGEFFDVTTESGQRLLIQRASPAIPSGFNMTFKPGKEFLLERNGKLYAWLASEPYPIEGLVGFYSIATTLLDENCNQLMVDRESGDNISMPIRINYQGPYTLTTSVLRSYYGYKLSNELVDLDLAVWKEVNKDRQHYYLIMPDSSEKFTIDKLTKDNPC